LPSLAKDNCYGRICLDDDYVAQYLDKEAYALIEKQISLKENLNIPFETITVSKVKMIGLVFILHMRKRHYYISEALIARDSETREWKILYEINYNE